MRRNTVLRKREKYLSKLPSLVGKVCVVTGGTGSLARNLILNLLFLGARVYFTYRNESKAKKLLEELSKFSSNLFAFPLDLSVKEEVFSFLKRLPERIDFFFHVAGTYHRPLERTKDGYERTYQTDFLSILWIDEELLMNHPETRIIHTGSVSMYYSKVDFKDPMSLHCAKTIRYGRDKRLLALYVLALKRRYPVRSFVLAHPGVSATSLFQSEKGGFGKAFETFLVPLMKVIFMKPWKASLSLLLGAFAGDGEKELVAPRGLFHSWGYPKVISLRKSLLESREKEDMERLIAKEKERIVSN